MVDAVTVRVNIDGKVFCVAQTLVYLLTAHSVLKRSFHLREDAVRCFAHADRVVELKLGRGRGASGVSKGSKPKHTDRFQGSIGLLKDVSARLFEQIFIQLTPMLLFATSEILTLRNALVVRSLEVVKWRRFSLSISLVVLKDLAGKVEVVLVMCIVIGHV